MVTASHNPACDNGFKLMLGGRPPDEATLSAIEQEMAAGTFARGRGRTASLNILPEYEAFLAQRFAHGGSLHIVDCGSRKGAVPEPPLLHIVVDCGNGSAGLVAPRVLAHLGHQVDPLFCRPDGRFPNRPPNPALAPNLAALQARVQQCGAGLGLAYDGDGDRVAFVDGAGRVAETDRVAVLLARHILKGGPGVVIHDVKCSSVLPEAVRAAGGTPIMARSGHAFIRAALLEHKALFGAEVSGHLFFAELGTDDALYASCALIEVLQATGQGLAELLAGVPHYPITPDIRLPCPSEEADLILEKLAGAFAGRPLSRLDGVRVDFGDGWALARRSVTEALLTLRFEAHTPARLEEIQDLVRERVPPLASIWRGN